MPTKNTRKVCRILPCEAIFGAPKVLRRCERRRKEKQRDKVVHIAVVENFYFVDDKKIKRYDEEKIIVGFSYSEESVLSIKKRSTTLHLCEPAKTRTHDGIRRRR